MKRNLIKFLALLLAGHAYAAGPAAAPKAAAAQKNEAPAVSAQKPSPWDGLAQHNIKTGDIAVYTPVTGIATAQDTYDIFAPFDGRIEELQVEVFNFVTPKTVMARMVSVEMAALLDSTSEESRKQMERRWQDVYSYVEIKPEIQGVVTNIYAEPRTRLNKGDRLFTVAKKVVVIGKNTEPLYSKPGPGMTADVEHTRSPDARFETRLVNFLRVKGSNLTYRLWLEVLDLKDGIKIGEQFNGVLFVGKSADAMLLPRKHMIESGGRRFLVTEIQTGLETAEELEILGHSSLYLEPVRPAAEIKDGKTKKTR